MQQVDIIYTLRSIPTIYVDYSTVFLYFSDISLLYIAIIIQFLYPLPSYFRMAVLRI